MLEQGLQMFCEAASKGQTPLTPPPERAAVALRMLYGLASTDQARQSALQWAGQVAKCVTDDAYPQAEAHWLVVQAHNAAVSAHKMRQTGMAKCYMAAAKEVAQATRCKAVSVASMNKILTEWGCAEA